MKVELWLIDKLKLDKLEDANIVDQVENDIDLIGWVSGRRIAIEVKIRHKDYGDFLLEETSNTTTKSKGWIYKSQAELLVYAIIENESLTFINILDLSALREWWIREGIYHNYSEWFGGTDNLYETLNYAIPWKDIPRDIIFFRGI